ncbi:hypothetical protein DL89DRAFT_255557 [Linderina pennispora]|uniref:Uncharacterized protein n=1 Tax=Linderina pennispora TaxID=61395 RepID=A0A1Y1WER5_9FUNG|nr:uncharacterized protein DL89DRAFT_255557 [Linderina pennispora]ORX71828.1 hypothetical protein DL89DRAFT_255557 [Linderina pennispora]
MAIRSWKNMAILNAGLHESNSSMPRVWMPTRLYAMMRPMLDPSMLKDKVFVCDQVSAQPFIFSISSVPFQFFPMVTCQVHVCKGIRLESFLPNIQLANDMRGLGCLYHLTDLRCHIFASQDPALERWPVFQFFVTRYMPPSAKTCDNFIQPTAPGSLLSI